MDLKIFLEGNFHELAPEEVKSINGGSPDKTTSFWYDLFYYASHWPGHLIHEFRDQIDENINIQWVENNT